MVKSPFVWRMYTCRNRPKGFILTKTRTVNRNIMKRHQTSAGWCEDIGILFFYLFREEVSREP